MTPGRRYAAAIAIVSGVYSIVVAGGGGMMGTNAGALMGLLGVVVVVHGVALVTPYADRLGDASGPLMIGYAVLMLLNQGLVGTTGSMNWGMGGMSGGMGGGMSGGMGTGMTGGMGASMPVGMGWDLGMIALAVLMLVSGVLMTSANGEGSM